MASIFRSLLLTVIGIGVAIALHTFLHFPVSAVPSSPTALETSSLERIAEIEQTWKTQYADYFEHDLSNQLPSSTLTALEIRGTLARLGRETQSQFALIYIFPHEEELELVALAPHHGVIRIVLPEVPKSVLTPVLDEVRDEVSRPVPSRLGTESAQRLYDWIVAPLAPHLEEWDIDTLIFCVGAGVRSLPLAALHNGQQFLIETYGVSIIPAFSLTNPDYDRVTRTQVLAMGASQFQNLQDLPAVPAELTAIAQDIWQGDVFLNEQFTQENLRQQLNDGDHAIVHLATHAAFQPGEPEDSYIQLWEDERITLNELADLGWRDRPVELLVLSACQTALGDPQAELGFAGLSYHAGVKSTLASLWQVSDIGTLGLMQEFYWQLAQPDVTTKTEALRRSQLAMLRGDVYLAEGYLYTSGGRLPLPDDFENFGRTNLSSPYYWAGFTLVGSPW